MASNPPRTELLQVRVSPDEKARIERFAAQAGMKPSEYVRSRALVDPKVATRSYTQVVKNLAGLEAAISKAREALGE